MLVRNLTPFPWGRLVTSRRPPQREMAVVVRGTFDVVAGGPCTISKGDPTIQGFVLGEMLSENDDPKAAAPLAPNDLVPMKLNAEVLVTGTCTAPRGKPVSELVVEVRVGEWSKGLVVVGRRVYSDRGGGAVASQPLPFTAMPLDYGRAYGGPGYAPNPAGAGITSDEAPNLEWPGERSTTRNRPPARGPASLGAVNVRWSPRAERIGKNSGAAWEKSRAPFFSDDFDWSYFHEAPADQQLRGYLRGDETFELVNLHPSLPSVSGRLPGIRPRFFIERTSGEVEELKLGLDTLVVLADEGRLRLSWRGSVDVEDEELDDIAAVVLDTEPLGVPRSESAYRAELARARSDAIPTAPPEILAKREEALAQLEAMQAAAEAARSGTKPPAEAIADQLVAALPKGDPRAADLRAGILSALAEHDAHVPPEHRKLDKIVGQPPPEPSPPPIRDLVPGEAPKLAPNRKLAKGIDDAIAAVADAEPHAAHDPKGEAKPQMQDMRSKLEALKVDPRFGPVFKARVEPGPGRDLSDLDLEGEDLRGADLAGADLRGSILTRADLRGARLRGARLDSAVLFRAILDEADLEGSHLSLTNFTGAQGAKASFRGVKLDRTFFEDANLDGADFSGATGLGGFFDRTSLVGVLFAGATLERSRFDRARLVKASFRAASLLRIAFDKCEMPGANFEGASLALSSFLGCRGEGSSFRQASGRSVSLQGSVFDGADFTLAVLPGVMMPKVSLVGAKLYGADLRGAKARGAIVDRASFDRANLAEADLRKASCHGTTFRSASLYAAVLLGASGAGADLAGANLKRCKIDGLR